MKVKKNKQYPYKDTPTRKYNNHQEVIEYTMEINSKPFREPIKIEALPGRNQPCYCGSNRKFKKCCINK